MLCAIQTKLEPASHIESQFIFTNYKALNGCWLFKPMTQMLIRQAIPDAIVQCIKNEIWWKISFYCSDNFSSWKAIKLLK